MRVSLTEFLRRTGLHEIAIKREPNRGREIDDLTGDAEIPERPAAGKPKGRGAGSIENGN